MPALRVLTSATTRWELLGLAVPPAGPTPTVARFAPTALIPTLASVAPLVADHVEDTGEAEAAGTNGPPRRPTPMDSAIRPARACRPRAARAATGTRGRVSTRVVTGRDWGTRTTSLPIRHARGHGI